MIRRIGRRLRRLAARNRAAANFFGEDPAPEGARFDLALELVDGPEALPARERMRARVLALVNILAPVPLKQLRAMAARPLGRYFPGLGTAPAFLAAMIKDGELEIVKAGGADYALPPGCDLAAEAPRRVSLLAPFDLLVWDRGRFEHFWGWAYRFEAYTPPDRRVGVPHRCTGCSVGRWHSGHHRRS